MLRSSTLASAFLLTALATPVRAEDDPDPLRFSRGLLSFTFENDTFADTDRYYTSGQRVAWQSRGGAPDPLATAGGWLAPWLLPDEASVEWGVSLSQAMYTSRKRLTREPPRDDRPYAGHLGAALSLQAAGETSLGVAELSLGVAGPAALAEQTQDLVHDLVGVEKLGGWDHQIGNRPVAMLSVERRWRLEPVRSEGLELDVVPALGANLGNLQTSAAAGFLLRLGHGLAMDFGPPRLRPALSGAGVFRPPEGLAGYLFLGVEGRAIAYDATLDGNRHGYWRVDREPLVSELPFGVTLAFGPLRLTASGVVQTDTFEEQSSDPHIFGATNLSLAF